MSYFGLNAVNQNQQLDEAASNPAGFNTDVGFFDNSGTAAVSGLYSGLVAKPDQLLWAGMDKIVSPIAKFVNENTSINDTSAEYIAEQRKLAEQQVKRLTPDAATTGTAGQVLHGLFDMGGQAVVGTLLSGPAGGAERTNCTSSCVARSLISCVRLRTLTAPHDAFSSAARSCPNFANSMILLPIITLAYPYKLLISLITKRIVD